MQGVDRFEREVAVWDRIYTGSGSLLTRNWNRVARANVRQRFDRTFELAEPLDGRTVLDVGAGTGQYTERALELGASRVVAIDTSAAMTAHLLAVRARSIDGARMEVICSDLDSADFQDERFDVVVINGVFDYVADPASLLSTASRLCRGVLIATAPDRRAFRAPIRRLYWKRRGLQTYYFSSAELLDLGDRAGLRSIRVERIGPIFLLSARSRS